MTRTSIDGASANGTEASLEIAASLDQALAAVAAGAKPIAGGTDLVVGARAGKVPLPDTLVAVDRLTELQQIERSDSAFVIGAGVTHATLMTDSIVVDNFAALADAAALVGSPATRNIGTLGGNVMNGSPAMDTGAPLLVLGGAIKLRSVAETRVLQIGELWLGPGETAARPDELCVGIELPAPPERSGSAYVRLEYRRAMEIAIVGAAASVMINSDGAVDEISVALAAVAPTIIGVEGLDELEGQTASEALLAEVSERASEQCTPITDLRASDRYRRHTVGVMAARAVDAAIRRANGERLDVPANRSLGIGAA